MSKTSIDLHLLYQLYVVDKNSVRKCAKVLKKDKSTVSHQLKKQGWLRKDRYQNRDDYGRFVKSGQELPDQELHNNPAFKWGETTYRRIAEIYRLPKFCYHCKTTRNLHIHHIDHNRENNDPSNLRYVCGSCHRKIEHKDQLEKRDKKGRFI
ncbi:HNH endonuclease signature motif containing protein [Cytobacillus firmus]|uniref:HNH endonuclease signature motif containing protein n=1 Tax=Cytobacillus firmus TaxID=1399 RepID=UPI0018CE65CD|nr:HNH endonuclease signature motif containing protein [Cytobacillus firmus]MBG9657101.1 hypothetical protein [Cytobacillus firmus]MED1906777.1 HNH endonuclease signature motif containing protein [Cytobacillus firmus]